MDLGHLQSLFVHLPIVAALTKSHLSVFQYSFGFLVGFLRTNNWTWLEAQTVMPIINNT